VKNEDISLHTSPSSRCIGVEHAVVAGFPLTDKISDSNSEVKADYGLLSPAGIGILDVRLRQSAIYSNSVCGVLPLSKEELSPGRNLLKPLSTWVFLARSVINRYNQGIRGYRRLRKTASRVMLIGAVRIQIKVMLRKLTKRGDIVTRQ
jgi:hypothetical protein